MQFITVSEVALTPEFCRRLVRLIVVISALLFEPELSNAELILSVDWDSQTPGVQTSLATTVNSGDVVSASIVAELTGGTTLYQYRFSVRYDSDRLHYRERFEPRPSNPLFVATFMNSIPDSEPGPQPPDTQPANSGDGFTHFRELWRFDGKEASGTDFLDSNTAGLGNGVVLGVVNFDVISTFGAGPLVKPGLFEISNEPGEVTVDNFTGNDGLIGDPRRPDNPNTRLIVQEGSITSVPEPSSVVLLGTFLLLVICRRYFAPIVCIMMRFRRYREEVFFGEESRSW